MDRERDEMVAESALRDTCHSFTYKQAAWQDSLSWPVSGYGSAAVMGVRMGGRAEGFAAHLTELVYFQRLDGGEVVVHHLVSESTGLWQTESPFVYLMQLLPRRTSLHLSWDRSYPP